MPWEACGGPGSTLLAVTLLVGASLAVAGPGVAGDARAAVDEEAAASFVEGSLWEERGTAVDYPGHVVFPTDSKRILDALAATGGSSLVDAVHAAEAAASLQHSHGGFSSFRQEYSPFPTANVRATGAAVALATAHGVPFDEEAAETYLRERQNFDGGFGGMASWNGVPGSYVTPTFYAVLGLDALDALDLETKLEVRGFLTQAKNGDGGWADWRWSRTSGTTATYLGVRTLAILDMLEPATKTEVAGFLELVEDPVEGGFHEWYRPPSCYFCSDEPPSVPSTGRALLTLDLIEPADATSSLELKTHAAWLAERQVDEGPFAGAFPLFGDAPTSIAHRGYGIAETVLGDEPVPRPFPRPEPAVTDWARNTALAIAGLEAVDLLGPVDLPEAHGFLADAQHEGTGGFGWWSGYLELPDATAAGYRVLDRLDRVGEPDALAATLSARQEDDGSIPQHRWELAPRLTHTANAIEALDRAGRLDAIDAEAAAGYIVDWQGEDGGFDAPGPGSDFETTRLAVRALDTLNRLDRIDTDGVASYLSSFQKDDGRITWVRPGDPVAAWDTAHSLRALSTVDRLDAVDVTAAVDFLASWEGEDGSYADSPWFEVPNTAHVVLGLSAVDRLDAIDAGAATSNLLGEQRDHGGFADRGHPPGPNAMVRHALALDALHELGEV